jgi:NitT/TauT family transport system permease protein
MRRLLDRQPWILSTLIVLLFFGALEVLTQTRVFPRAIIVPPSLMAKSVWILIQKDLPQQLAASMITLLTASSIAFVVGGLMGLAFWRIPALGRVFEPYLIASYAVPMVLLYPFVLVVAGIGAPSIIVIAATMGTVPMALNVWIGLRGLPDIYLRVAKSVNARPWQVAIKVILPGAAPMIFAGVKLAFIYAFIGTIASEFIVSTEGIGFLIARDYNYFNTADMYAEILVLICLAGVLNSLLLRAERAIANR